MHDDDLPADNWPHGLEIDLPHREVRVEGELVSIGGRAFDILRVMAEASGSVVPKSELISRIWPGVITGDNALQVHISGIRKALGADRGLLKTVPGRGYRLLGKWTLRQAQPGAGPAGAPPAAAAPPGTLSPAVSREVNAQSAASVRQAVFRSGDCEIDVAQRQVRIRGTPVPIGGRAFDIVATLAQSVNELVTREQLLEHVWSGVTVGKNAIEVHIFAIRKALGSYRALLRTVPRRGYCLVGQWDMQRGDRPAPTPSSVRSSGSSNLPAVETDLVGRAASLECLQEVCSAYRLVTLAGPGGIGKTALAIELARGLLPKFDGGVWLVELASLADPNLVPLTAAEAIGIRSSAGVVSAEAVARGIGPRHLLLVLDNCEHLIGAATQLAEHIIRLTPNAVILATSRETLRAHGEFVYRVPPLAVPPRDTDEAARILDNSAVQLFVDRAEALHVTGLREARNLRPIAEICRHLDGIPLAIEFAAARTASLGLTQIATGLADRFALLTTGRRTALPRHRTLRAVFDWSYALLSEPERVLFHRLAIFAGGASLNAVCAVMHISAGTEVADLIVSLAEKSMVSLDGGSPGGRLRLLETVRAYAAEKLGTGGELQAIACRHAEYFRGLFATCDPDADPGGSGDELAPYIREVDNLRAALTWAFSASGDSRLGGQLAVAAVKFWLATSLLDECCNWLSKALAETDGTGDLEYEMVLRSGLGQALMFTAGATSATHTNLTRALAIAEAVGNIEHQKRAVHGLWQISLRSVELRKALLLSRRYAEFAQGGTDLAAMRTANLMVGMSLTYLAEYGEASDLLERAIRDHPAAQHQGEMASLGLDGLTSAFGHLSTCLLARGLIDASIRAAERSIQEAQQIGQPVAVCLAMTRPAGLLFPEVGAFDTAEHYIAAILEQADRHALHTFRALAACANGRMLFMRGDPAAAAAALRSGLAQMEATGYRSLQTIFRGYFAEALTAAGNADEGLAESEAALRYAEQTEYMRFVPELLCIHGHVIARSRPDDPAAEQTFLRAIELARQQQALYWELRAALGLAELRQTRGRRGEAHALLSPVYQRFTEGFATPALVRAHALLRAIEDDS